MRLEVLRCHADATIPVRAFLGDAGLDLHACEALEIAPGMRASVATGISIALPAGHAGLVVPRSGIASKHGITVVNGPGLIDEGYRGEIRVLLLNTDRDKSFVIAVGDRIAQLVIIAVATPEIVEVLSLDETARGEGGFGSSGR